MMSLVKKSTDWPPNYHKILIFSPPRTLKRLRVARIDELADSNEPAMIRMFVDFFVDKTNGISSVLALSLVVDLWLINSGLR